MICCEVRIIAECGNGRDDIRLLVRGQILLEAGDEGLRLIVGRLGLIEEGRKNDALCRGACVLDDRGVLPGITSGDQGLDTELPCLLDDERRCRDGGRCEDDVRVRGLDVREHCLKIGLVRLELLLVDDGSAELLKCSLEEGA